MVAFEQAQKAMCGISRHKFNPVRNWNNFDKLNTGKKI